MTILGLFLNDELRTGGHRRYLELLEGLAARGNRVIAVMNERLQYSPQGFEALKIHAPYVRNGFPPVGFRFRDAVRRAMPRIRAASSDALCLLVHGETHFLAALEMKHALGVRIVFGHRTNAVREGLALLAVKDHGVREDVTARWEILKYRRYEKLVARESATVVFQSAFDRDDFCSRAPLTSRQSAIIPGNIGEPRFPASMAEANHSRGLTRVLFIGNYGVRKGGRYFVEAIEALARRGMHGLLFRMVGPGDQKAGFEARVRSEGLEQKVSFAGRVSDPFNEIANADLLVVPSLFDSFPDTVLEAIHVGTPVIGSRVGGIPEQLMHDELLFPSMDSVAIADRIERCANDASFYRRLKELTLARRAPFLFDWAEAWERVIASAAESAALN